MDEFDFIGTYLAPLAGPEGLGLTDDAACFTPPPDRDLVFTKDTLVEGVHFPKGRRGRDTAEKLLRVNLSDLAAKGARPIGYLLSFAIPTNIDRTTLDGFAQGLSEVQETYGFKLWGGDTVTTHGPMVITATLIGMVPLGGMVKRSGAKIGDDLWVSGTIGDSYLGLQQVLRHRVVPKPSGDALKFWEQAYFRPNPRLALLDVLRKFATAAIDISDGLIADISHVARNSDVGIKVYGDNVPLSKHTQVWLDGQRDKNSTLIDLLTGGDDYEIAFTANPSSQNDISEAVGSLGLAITRIGSCEEGMSARLVDKNGDIMDVSKPGYIHF